MWLPCHPGLSPAIAQAAPSNTSSRPSSGGQQCDLGFNSKVHLGISDSRGRNAHAEERLPAQLSRTFYPNSIAWSLSSSSSVSDSLLGHDPSLRCLEETSSIDSKVLLFLHCSCSFLLPPQPQTPHRKETRNSLVVIHARAWVSFSDALGLSSFQLFLPAPPAGKLGK